MSKFKNITALIIYSLLLFIVIYYENTIIAFVEWNADTWAVFRNGYLSGYNTYNSPYGIERGQSLYLLLLILFLAIFIIYDLILHKRQYRILALIIQIMFVFWSVYRFFLMQNIIDDVNNGGSWEKYKGIIPSDLSDFKTYWLFAGITVLYLTIAFFVSSYLQNKYNKDRHIQ